MAKTKEKVDHFKLICEKTDRLSAVYKNDSFWQTMRTACEDVLSSRVNEDTMHSLNYEARHWPPGTSNAKALRIVIDEAQLETEKDKDIDSAIKAQ